MEEKRVGQDPQEDQIEYYDNQRDLSQQLPTNWNLAHLTSSRTALIFFLSDPLLADLVPLVDQIVATNKIDERGRELYRCMISSQINEMMLWADEDDDSSFAKINTARLYLFMLIDGMKDGYRGKLATELRRVLRREVNPQPQRREFLR
jgi:hypothetical protein